MSLNRSAFILFLLIPLSIFSQTSKIYWTEIQYTSELSAKMNADLVLPANSKAYRADHSRIMSALKASATPGKESIISLPVGVDGKMVDFYLNYDPVMGVSDRVSYSDIMTFSVSAVNNVAFTGRVGISKSGFYGTFEDDGRQIMLRHGEGMEKDKFFVYNLDTKLALLDRSLLHGCGTESIKNEIKAETRLSLRNEEKRMRHFRIAISCTSGYASIVGGTAEKVMEKVVQTLNLTNFRYNLDFGIKLDLIDSTERFFNLEKAGDFFVKQSEGLELLQQNQDFLDSLISPDEYDLAQVFTKNCTDVGGVVWGRACDNNNKARGVSCRSDDEDYFFTTFKHEVGHQFDGGHTFNACNGSTQYDPNSSYEPGAGSTILSYGNNCGEDNVGERKDYFHVINIIEVTNFVIEAEAICGTFGPDINHNPVATVLSPRDITVPILTPFELEGHGSDLDENQLTYNWEQFDLGEGDPLGTNFETGPLFITQEPRSSGATRLFPKLSDILGDVSSKGERLPEVSRELNFMMTIRDNDKKVGAQDIAAYQFNATEEAGPFKITFPTKGNDTIFSLGQYVLVEWDVANTDLDPVNCKFVNIIHSTNDGLTFPDTLVARTPNDGSEYIMFPKATGKSRIKVKAADNIFLDISRRAFKVVIPANAGYSLDILPHNAVTCNNSVFEYKVRSVKWLDYNTPVKIEVVNSGNAGLIVTPSADQFLPGQAYSLWVDTKNVAQAGSYTIELRAVAPGYDTIYRTVTIAISGDEQKFNGEKTPQHLNQEVELSPVFEWNKTNGSSFYEVQISEDPSFTVLTYTIETTDSKFTYPAQLEGKKIYYWRVRSLGTCGFGRWSDLLIFRTVSTQSGNILQQVNNVLLSVHTNSSKFISHDDLYFFSLQQPDENLTFTLLSYPEHGFLHNGSELMTLGSEFTQQDIDDLKVLYTTEDPTYQGGDYFDFLSFDSNGTFIGPERFLIDINDGHPASSRTINLDDAITMMPNPAGNIIQLQYVGKEVLKDVNIQIFGVNGNIVRNEKHEGVWRNTSIDLTPYVSGTYVVVLKSGNYISKKRLVKL